jgi:nucleoside-diphosphate-sugar epimerase
MAGDVALVTGANGLIGHALIRRLHDAGRAVVAMDRVAPSGLAPEVPVVIADLADAPRIAETMTRFAIGAVVHCGAISGPMVANDKPDLVFRVNVGGTMNVVAAARRAGVGRFVFVSSVAAYGGQPTQGPVSESAPLLANDPYGASKVACEAILGAYRRAGLDVVALRPTSVYGPRRTTDCAIRQMIWDAQAGRPTRFSFGPDARRQFVHVDDTVDAVARALDAPPRPRLAYNVSGDTWLTLGEIAAAVRRVLPQADVQFVPPDAARDSAIGALDLGAAQRELGYAPRISLEDGIRSYADWLAAQQRS